MWDTSKDYRLIVAQKAVEQFVRTIEGANLRGSWNKKNVLVTAKNMLPEIQALYYSYVPLEDIASSSHMQSLLDGVDQIISDLGGENYSRQFLSQLNKEERMKLDEPLAKIKFFINTIRGLPDRLKLGEIDDPIIGVDILVGKLASVSKHPDSDSLMVCNVNLGKRAITVITNDMTVKDNDHVAVALLFPTSFMGIASEGMFLGAGEGILKGVQGELGSLPKRVDMDAFIETRNMVDSFINS
ncbi:MAG: tRNA-binding protein [Methanobacteriaceae archaeon]|nr:tRNA-binding protein [Methanobacteriaceae archaeon]